MNVYVTGSAGNGSDNDFVTISYDKDGNLRWYKTYSGGAGSDDNAFDVVVDSSQNVYVSGSSATATTKYVTLCYQQWAVPASYDVDTSGTPVSVKNQYIVRFNPSMINSAFASNKDLVFGSISNTLSGSGVSYLTAKLGANILKANAIKVFKELTPKDSVTQSRLGETIKIPDFWTTLLLVTGNGYSLSEQTTLDSLNSLSQK